MNFDLPFYKFRYSKMPLYELISKLDMKSYHRDEHNPIRTCPFNINLINRFFLYDSQYRLYPKTHMKILFSPRIAPDYTMLLIMGGGAFWENWLADASPDLETMSLRFRTNDKDENAIRELLLWRGRKWIRIVRVMKDPKWKLYVDREPQPFEEGKTYEKVARKPIREYFTFEDMVRFATNWGCPFDKDEFWASDQPMYCLGHLENDEDLADWTVLDEHNVRLADNAPRRSLEQTIDFLSSIKPPGVKSVRVIMPNE